MASLFRDGDKRWRIQFKNTGGNRCSIRLSKTGKRQANAIRVKVEQLVAASITGHSVDDETARWVSELSDTMRDKLTTAGLIAQRDTMTLGRFLDAWIAKRENSPKSTLQVWGHAKRNLIKFFGRDKLLRDITRGDASDWRLWLINREKLAETSTVRKRCSVAKQFFSDAVDRRLVPDNVFDHLPAAVQKDAEREHFITRQVAEDILDACPDAEWRAIFALARYGGLRCPSEIVELKWDDILWDKGRMLVTSPKTRHHEGRQSRLVPLFPELRKYLDELWDQVPPKTVYVTNRIRKPTQNVGTTMRKIIKRAGHTPWPKLMNNLRSSRQTELEDEFPSHVVCKWLGNSRTVAVKHYLQVTDDHFDRAAKDAVDEPLTTPANASAEDVFGVVQKVVQQLSEMGRNALQDEKHPASESLSVQGISEDFASVQGTPDGRYWTTTDFAKAILNQHLRQSGIAGGAQSGAISADVVHLCLKILAGQIPASGLENCP